MAGWQNPDGTARHWPVLQSLRGYKTAWIGTDVSAGLAIAAVGLPSAIAYPAIAGLPPQTGLYASIAPLVAYAILGPSRRLVVGPDAATMTVLAAILGSVAVQSTDDAGTRLAMAAQLALAVGLMCFLARALRLGVIASFLSRPILVGFFAGISLSILVGQLGRMTGVKIEADGLLPPLAELMTKAEFIHWPTLVLAITMFALLQGARYMRLPVPGSVIVVVVSVLLSFVLDLQGRGVAIVGDLPEGLPTFALPSGPWLPLEALVLGSSAIFLVSFGAGIITARSFGAQTGEPVDANRELVGFGAANMAAGFFGAFPVTASDSRTAVNISVGGQSQISSLVAAGALIATLLFLGPALRLLPIPALGAILASTAIGMIDLAALRRVWSISRMEFAFALIALLGPLSLGVLQGVVIAVGASMVHLLRRTMHPNDAILGRIPDRAGFYKMHRFPKAGPVPGLGLFVIQGSILFFNAEAIQSRMREIAAAQPKGARWLVMDAGVISQIDTTGAEMLGEMVDEFARAGLRFGLAELHAEPRELLRRAGVLDRIGAEMIFDDLEDALRAFGADQVIQSEEDKSHGQEIEKAEAQG